MARIFHYVQNTLESETPTSICGLRTSHASSTENPQAVTCIRCKKKLGDQIKAVDLGVQASPNGTDPEEKVEAVETVEQQAEEQVEIPVEEQPSEQVSGMVGLKYILIADGAELDGTDDLSEATKKAVEASQALEGVIVNVVEGGQIRHRYKNGKHLPPLKSKPPTKANVHNIADAKGKVAAPKPPTRAEQRLKEKVPPKPTTMNECVCGCGGKTVRTFCPGHDARVHSWMKKITKGDLKIGTLPPIAQKYIKQHSA